jgi:hypothetical protein
MIRKALLAGLIALAACAQSPQPTPHADGEIVTRAVELAQARADHTREREYRK